jgi:hypothetical protein
VGAALTARARGRETAVWQTLAAKERLCEMLDSLLRSRGDLADAAATTTTQWTALPALPAAWEKVMLARRDAALHAFDDVPAAAGYLARIEDGAQARLAMLLELEMQLGLECPPELQAQRLALQVQRLRDRFQNAAAASARSAGERLVAWCAQPGVADARDRQRCERIFAAVHARGGSMTRTAMRAPPRSVPPQQVRLIPVSANFAARCWRQAL